MNNQHIEEENNKRKSTECYMNKIIANQKRTNNLLTLNVLLLLAIIVIKLFITG